MMLHNPWEFKQYDVSEATKLQQSLSLAPVFIQLLAQRGIKSPEAAQQFLEPSLDQLHNPFQMKDMHLAVKCIQCTIDKGGRILLFGDYDADGLCATALMYRFIYEFYTEVLWQIPNRLTEGYGLSEKAVQWAIQQDISLIICLDCGSNNYSSIAKAKKAGIAVIIVDHHALADKLPEASAILNPRQKSCKYPFKELSACAVAFKLATAFALHRNWSFKSTVLIYIDLVAISIAADFVPMNGENRVLAHSGLVKLNAAPCLGLEVLIKHTNLEGIIDINKIVFYLAPILNAAGRLGKAAVALGLLIEPNKKVCTKTLVYLKQLNAKRKKIQADILKDIVNMERQQPAIFEEPFLVLYQADWHPGLLGVIAAKMVAKYQKPCLVCTLNRGIIQGSARSTNNFDIQHFFEKMASESIQSGGHAFAAGIQFHPNEFESIRSRMLAKARPILVGVHSVPKQRVDAVLEMNDIDALFWASLQQFAPFGPENKRPLFVLKGIKKTNRKRLLGQAHIKFCLGNDLPNTLTAIAFNQYKYWKQLQSYPVFDFCFVLEQQQYKEHKYLQLNIKDMYFAAIYP